MAEYIVMKENGDSWVECKRVEAGSRLAAIEKAAETEGRFFAITENQVMRVGEVSRLQILDDGRGA